MNKLQRMSVVLSMPIRWLLIGIVRVYQHVISPWLGPNCRFSPTCSEYFVQAVRKRGLIVGVSLGFWRVLRCNPFCEGGYDPVPDRTRGDDAMGE